MRLVLLVAITAFILCGCGNGGKTMPDPEEPSFKTVYNGPSKLPDLDAKTSLEMRAGDKSIKIGIAAELLRDIFPKPEKATDVRELPPGFPEEYISRGWETEEEGVGWLSYSGQIVCVLHTVKHLEEGDLKTDFVDKYTREFSGIEPIVITGRNARFWFWQEGTQRFMISAGKSRKGGIDVTEVLGDIAVMDAMRMAPSKAEFDKERTDSAWAADAEKAANAKRQPN